MDRVFILYLLLGFENTVISDVYDPTKVDYCALKCGGEENVACHCTIKKDGRQENRENLAEFRKTMVEEHNNLRNKFASGIEASKGFPAAADMRVLNYDMELEYLAMCHARKMQWEHDKCSMPRSRIATGQNIKGSGSISIHEKPYDHTVQKWYNEINDILPTVTDERKLDLIDSFGHTSDMVKKFLGHFTQVIWAGATHVGCFRMSIPTNRLPSKYVIVCDYGGPKGGGNVQFAPIYERGKSCTKCPKGTQCNKKYTHLCGEIEPIPEDVTITPDLVTTNGTSNSHRHGTTKGNTDGTTGRNDGVTAVTTIDIYIDNGTRNDTIGIGRNCALCTHVSKVFVIVVFAIIYYSEYFLV